MDVIKCPIHRCEYQMSEQPRILLDLHNMENEKNSGSSNDVVMPNAPQLIGPKVYQGILQGLGSMLELGLEF